MTNGGARVTMQALWKKLSSPNGIVTLVVVGALIIGFLIGSPVGRIISGILLGIVLSYWIVPWRRIIDRLSNGNVETEEAYSQSPEKDMKKLLFDDFQPQRSSYVVKEIQEEEIVVPSTRTIQAVPMTRAETVREFQVSDFFDLDSDIFSGDTEPKSEFSFLLGKTLVTLKDVLFAHSAAFFWVNREKFQLVLETKATSSQNFMTSKRFTIEDDVLSKVAHKGKPQVLGRVNPISEKELIRYYDSPEYVKSVIAVPVYYFKGEAGDLPVGVIVADSKAEDAFGVETLTVMGHYTKLVSALIKSYTDKYDMLLDSELLSSIRRMQDRIRSEPSEIAVLNALADEASRLVNWDFLAITMYADEHRGWILQKVVNRINAAYVLPDQKIDFNESLVGETIRKNSLISIEDLESESRVRFCQGEEQVQEGSFLAVPLSSINRCYGALSLESRVPRNFTGSEVETMYRLVENAALALEVLYMNDLVKDFVVIDQATGLFNTKYFLKKLEEEVKRADDFGMDLSLVSLVVDCADEQMHRYGREGFETIIQQIARNLRTGLRPYDIIGRLEGDTIGIVLVNTAASDAYLWAEKLRKQIASHIIGYDGKSFSVTVSVGVCGLTEGMQTSDLLSGTSKVLSKAIENGGNLVRVY